MIHRCIRCQSIGMTIASRAGKQARQYMCLPCWEQGGFSLDGWVVAQKDYSQLYSSLQVAQDNLSRLERLLDTASTNIREEIAIRQMEAIEGIVSDVLTKYGPEIEAIKAAIEDTRRHINALAQDADNFAA